MLWRRIGFACPDGICYASADDAEGNMIFKLRFDTGALPPLLFSAALIAAPWVLEVIGRPLAESDSDILMAAGGLGFLYSALALIQRKDE
jgi:hypothetical protein